MMHLRHNLTLSNSKQIIIPVFYNTALKNFKVILEICSLKFLKFAEKYREEIFWSNGQFDETSFLAQLTIQICPHWN